MENSVCDDYVTEKLWRAYYIGSVPLIYGSPKIKDILPNNKSAIEILDFKSPKHLADFINDLNQNDEEYDKYLEYKTEGKLNIIHLMK